MLPCKRWLRNCEIYIVDFIKHVTILIPTLRELNLKEIVFSCRVEARTKNIKYKCLIKKGKDGQ